MQYQNEEKNAMDYNLNLKILYSKIWKLLSRVYTTLFKESSNYIKGREKG